MNNETDRNPDLTLSSFSEQDTQNKAEILGKSIIAGDLILLYGNLGAGKTRIVQGFTMGINSSQIARSPTFVLITKYTGDIILYHCDLFRIKSPEEVIDLELEELLENGALAVEWPEKGGNYIPNGDLIIRTVVKDETSRELKFFSRTERGNHLIEHLKNNI